MSPIPYGFLPIDPAASVHDAPIWRDGRSDAPRFSGELLITLTALTPLIVGNHQHALDDKHSLLVPQMLDDGRVLIGAASLKGMLRAALASLLHAPMERVSEHHYTYRPNLAGSGKAKEIRAAVVLSDHHSKTDPLQVALLDPKEVVYLPTNIWKALKCPAPGNQLARGCTGLKFSGPDELDNKAAFRKKIIVARTPDGEQDRNARITLDHTVLCYAGGIDGEGRLAKAFNENRTIYQYVLYPTRLLEQAMRKPVSIASAVVAQYHETQRILADMQIGHLAPGHPLLNKIGDPKAIQKAIEAHTPLYRHQLIYVEYDSNTRQITSLGHHYHYRWAYTSSVTRKGGKKRRELDWLPVETKNPQTGQPERLAAHRLLFGYALDGGEEGPAGGNFRRLAGRIAFNTAIEIPGNKTLEERFVNGGEEIQLRILGMPRPSAVEFYLKQTALPKKLITYGDQVDDLGGDLAGRKFYRHQPDAARSGNLYSPTPAESRHDVNTEERGTRVRYLSRPGSQFRCTLRFDSLRPWELGALLAALDPHRLAVTFGLPPSPEGYAHKLGYGKPLGLGSVRLQLDAARWRENDGWTWQQATGDDQAWRDWSGQALAALKEKLLASWPDDRARSTHLTAWLAARRWAKSGRAAYPTRAGKGGQETIFDYHTALRRDHAAARRGDDRKSFHELKKLLECST